MQVVYVDSPEGLSTAVQMMRANPDYLAMDTEFRRENTYFPELCLIQVATHDTVFLIDALAVTELDAFFEILVDPTILKVFHSGRQDLEIFCHLMHGNVTQGIFDTQIAATFLGYGESAGFEGLVLKLLGVTLDKSSRHTDWTRRPLKEEQKTYAINDVLYLRPIYEKIKDRLNQKQRLRWASDAGRSLESPTFLITPPKEAWLKLSLRSSHPRYIALVQSLAEWRETTAQRMNLPRSWLVKDEAILEIAQRKPQTLDALKKIPTLSLDDPLMGDEILALMDAVLSLPEDALPSQSLKTNLSRAQQNVLELLKLLLKTTAEDLDLNPKMIAEKEDLTFWLAATPHERESFTQDLWQTPVFWDNAQDLLDGKLTACIHHHNVIFERTRELKN